jgi:hypothetical protein
MKKEHGAEILELKEHLGNSIIESSEEDRVLDNNNNID